MTTAIIYYSKHHGNTKKLLDAIKVFDDSVALIDVTEHVETVALLSRRKDEPRIQVAMTCKYD